VGRLSELDVKINDTSVSRIHSKIIFEKENFYLEDMSSKFGTLVRLPKPIAIPPQYWFRIHFQVGKTLFEVSPILN
jgi:hypothetical protein